MKQNRPSKKAELAAMIRAVACKSKLCSGIVDDPYAQIFLSPMVLVSYLKNLAICNIGNWRSSRGMVELVLFALCRHRYIEDVCMDYVTRGYKQLVLLGAGYDTKALRMPFGKDVSIVEIDDPATQVRKKKKIQRLGIEVQSPCYIPGDLFHENPDTLLDKSELDRSAPVIIVAEGVFSCFSAPRVHGLLHQLSCISSDIVLIFDYRSMAVGSNGAAEAKGCSDDFSRIGERTLSYWTQEQMQKQLTDTGFTICSHATNEDLWSHYVQCKTTPQNRHDLPGIFVSSKTG